MKKSIAIIVALVLVAALAYCVVRYAPSWSVQGLYDWYKSHMTYGVIVLLMAIESSIIPLPSEIVVPPAAYFALQPGSSLEIVLVVVAATVGALLGSVINYGVSMLVGRPIVYAFADSRVGHMFMLNSEKMQHAEDYFNRKGAVSIFLGRLLPAVRHLISIPAGLSRMNFGTFTLFTTLGAALWNVVLAALGYLLFLAVPDDSQLFTQLEHYNHYLKLAGYALLAVVAAWIAWKAIKKKRSRNKEADTPNP